MKAKQIKRLAIGATLGAVVALLALLPSAPDPAAQMVTIDECIEVHIRKPKRPNSSSTDIISWAYQFENTCESTLRIVNHERQASGDHFWDGGRSHTVKGGERSHIWSGSATWSRETARKAGYYGDLPPSPLLAWCVYNNNRGEGQSRCYGANKFDGSKPLWQQSNWNGAG